MNVRNRDANRNERSWNEKKVTERKDDGIRCRPFFTAAVAAVCLFYCKFFYIGRDWEI